MLRRYKIMQKLVDLVLPGYHIIYPPYDRIEVTDHWVSSGTGPEEAIGTRNANPNWYWNKAANCVAVAKWLEKHGA